MKILSTFLALLGLVTVTVAFANDGVTPISSIGVAEEPIYTAACNGDYWCCSNWFGCHCKNGMPEVVKSCQKGQHCVHEGGDRFRCDKGRVAKNVTPLAALEASPPASTEVAPVDDPVHAAACNGDYWCCDKWHGCQCVNGMPKAVANCQKGTHCVYQGNGSFRCDKGNRKIRGEETDNAQVTESAALNAAQPTFAEGSDYKCGRCNSIEGFVSNMKYNQCTNITPNDEGKAYRSCFNEYCGLCMVFADRDCQGDIVAQPSKGQGWVNVKGAKSYWCY